MTKITTWQNTIHIEIGRPFHDNVPIKLAIVDNGNTYKHYFGCYLTPSKALAVAAKLIAEAGIALECEEFSKNNAA